LRPTQYVSVSLAVLAVLAMTVLGESLPWIALTLAISFGFYGLIRKTTPIDSVVGLTIETLFLLPIGLLILTSAAADGRSSFASIVSSSDYSTLALLIGSGVVTAFPLLLFGMAARRLPLTTLGFVQYIGPTLQWMLAVFWYREPLRAGTLGAFILIWIALLLYSIDLALAMRRGRTWPGNKD
jgi:chloramphenicol-sensitive protein RarD